MPGKSFSAGSERAAVRETAAQPLKGTGVPDHRTRSGISPKMMNRSQFDRLWQKIRDAAPRFISPHQDYLAAIHEAGHVVGYWAIGHKIRAKHQRYWERQMRENPGKVIPRPLPVLPSKFQVVLRTLEEIEAGPYHDRSGRKTDCHGIVEMEERLELSAGERVKFYAVGLLTGPIAEIYEASFDKYHQDYRGFAQGNYHREYIEAWKIVFHQYGAKITGKGQMEKLTTEAHDLVGNHWAAIEALAAKLVEKQVIEGEEAIAIIEAAEAHNPFSIPCKIPREV